MWISRRKQKQREDNAWSEGYRYDDDEVEDFIAGKDAFIEKQSGIILDLMKVLDEHQLWHEISDELRYDLANYV
jgi:hypothetical protein